MKTSRVYPFLLAALLLIVSLACVRSIPNPNATQEAEGQPESLPTDATDVMNQIYLFATQTAMGPGAATSVSGTPEAQATPGAEGTPVTAGTPATEGAPAGSTPPGQQVAQPTPAATATPYPEPPPLVVPDTYTLQRGEFPFCIARRFNLDPVELLQINGISSYSVVQTGMVLRIPKTGNPFPGNRALQPHPATYNVGGGDTIYTIACAFGDVDPDAIAYVNGLTAPYRLSVGQQLQIP
jgi:LysM repeat protein